MNSTPPKNWEFLYRNPQKYKLDKDIPTRREFWKERMRYHWELAENTPDHILKDILLDNDFIEYCDLLFPEHKR